MPDVDDAPQRPLLRPWITADAGGLVLMYADAGGRTVRLRLTAVDLAHLALSATVAQAGLAARDLNDAVQGAHL